MTATISEIHDRIDAVNEELLQIFPYYQNEYKDDERRNKPLYLDNSCGENLIALVLPNSTGQSTIWSGTKAECLEKLRNYAYREASFLLYRHYYFKYTAILNDMLKEEKAAIEIKEVLERASGAYVSSENPLQVTFVSDLNEQTPSIISKVQIDEDAKIVAPY